MTNFGTDCIWARRCAGDGGAPGVPDALPVKEDGFASALLWLLRGHGAPDIAPAARLAALSVSGEPDTLRICL